MFRGQKALSGRDVVDIGQPVWDVCVLRRDGIVKATGVLVVLDWRIDMLKPKQRSLSPTSQRL